MVHGPAMQTVLLAGGLGTRLSEETESRPKPMVEIGPWPILRHIMQLYADQGYGEFVVAVGYLGHVIKRYFRDVLDLAGDLTFDLANRRVASQGEPPPAWIVNLVDTGVHTQTAGRLKRLAPHLRAQPFMVTYGDGLCSVDLRALLSFHHAHGKLATLTAVRPAARFGALALEGERVSAFVEKTQLAEGWINGGFMVLQPEVLERVTGDDCVLERDILPQLAAEGQLGAYRHHGYWQCMDTLRDVRTLQEQWSSGRPPWTVRG
jgi:glucose-1-phosphate cytidylyltransferase